MTQLQHANLNDQVYEVLRRQILRRDFGPGAKVSVHELASALGVSRSPVHHALTRLVSDGLLSVKARRGYFVTPVTPELVSAAYDVRLALELYAAERTVGGIATGSLDPFEQLLQRSEQATTEEEWNAANAAFHEFQIDLAGNVVLSHVYREMPVNAIVQVIRGSRVEGDGDLLQEHRAIVEAFEAADLAAAQQAIRTHIASGERLALDVIGRAGGVL